MKAMGKVEKIIIHCSASSWGDVDAVDRWHRARGWDMIGYAYLITNGIPRHPHAYKKEFDGLIQAGRPESKQGAHCRGHNHNSIGICLIGDRYFTSLQLFDALPDLLSRLFESHNLAPEDVFGHYEFNDKKTCPNVGMVEYRKYLLTRFPEVIKRKFKGDEA